jgi:mono/diheme cytochrome c family protein
MKNKIIILVSFGAGILATVLVPIFVLAMGWINMGADVKPGLIEKTLAPWAVDRSVGKRSPKEKNSYAGDPAAIATGLNHYRENCVICHGAPDMSGAELSQGINPPAPSLDNGADGTPDGQLFWVIKHGIRMTAMPAFGPTHTDEEIWKLVAFIRHLPDLTAQEHDTLRPADGTEAHHHGGENIVPPGKTVQPVQPARGTP